MKDAFGKWVTMGPNSRYRGKHGRIAKDWINTFSVVTDGSRDFLCCRESFVVHRRQEPPHPYFPMRQKLPYGRYLIGDGGYVFHNRDYQPIMHVHPDGRREPCLDPREWITFVSEEWFYDDSSAPWLLRDPRGSGWDRPKRASDLASFLEGAPVLGVDMVHRDNRGSSPEWRLRPPHYADLYRADYGWAWPEEAAE